MNSRLLLALIFTSFITASTFAQRSRKSQQVNGQQWVSLSTGVVYKGYSSAKYFGLSVYNLQLSKLEKDRIRTYGLRFEFFFADRYDPVDLSNPDLSNSSFLSEAYYAKSIFKKRSIEGFDLKGVLSIGYYKEMYISQIATGGANRWRDRLVTIGVGIQPSFTTCLSKKFFFFAQTQATFFEMGVLEYDNFNPALTARRSSKHYSFYNRFFKRRFPIMIGIRKRI